MNIHDLPAPVRAKFSAVRQACADTKALRDSTQSAINVNEGNCLDVARLRDSRSNPEDARQAALELDELRDEHQQLVTKLHRLDDQWNARRQVFSRVETFIECLPASAPVRTVPPRKADYSAAALTLARAACVKLASELQRVEMAPLDRKSFEATVAAYVDELRAQCHVNVQQPMAAQFKAGYQLCPASFFKITIGITGGASIAGDKTMNLLAWLDPDRVKAMFLAAIPVADGGMSVADKAAARERLQGELLSAERLEESLIVAAAAAGVTVERRIEADPRAVLGITIIASEADVAA